MRFTPSPGILVALAMGLLGARAGEPGYVNPDGSIAIVGYNDMDDLIARWDPLVEASHPGIRFKPDLPSTRSAPPALARGASLLAPMGAEMSEDQLAPFIAADGRPPVAVRVAHASVSPRAKSGPIAVFVNASNPLSSLTVGEVARIFSGGAAVPGSPSRAYANDPDTPLAQFMVNSAFSGRAISPGVKTFHQSRDVVAAVAADPDGIGFASANALTPSVRALAIARAPGERPVPCDAASVGAGHYPFDRFLLIYLRHPRGKTLDPLAVDYVRLVLSARGQAEVARSRQEYLPLTPAEASEEEARINRILAADRP